MTATNLAAVLVDLGRPREAIPLLRDALEHMSTRLGSEHEDLAIVHDALGFAEITHLELDRHGSILRVATASAA